MSAVSLVVPVFKGWNHARKLLRELQGDPPCDIEIVVVDDASEDGGAAALEAECPNVRLVVREVNGGFAAAVNSGVAASSGAVIIVSNSDVLLDHAAIQRLGNAVRSKPHTIIGPRTLCPSGREVPIAHDFPSPWQDCRELFLPLRLWRRIAGARSDRSRNVGGHQLVSCDWVIGSCMAFSRDAWAQAGPLDESFGMYSEEVDWQRRASERGVDAGQLLGATVIHDETHGLERGSPSDMHRFRQIWSSRFKYHERYGGHTATLKLRVLWLAAFAVSGPMLGAAALLLPGRRPSLAKAELQKSATLARAALRTGNSLGATR